MDASEIKKAFTEAGLTLTKDDYWKVQSTFVIYHKALERLAAAYKIKWDMPTVIRAERDEAVIMVSATRPDKDIMEWSIGEALVGTNYKVSGKQAGYVYAMAEKRGKDRVIIKLAGLHGAYSDDEAEDFRRENRTDGGDIERTERPAPESEKKTTRAKAPAEKPNDEAAVEHSDEAPSESANEDAGAAVIEAERRANQESSAEAPSTDLATRLKAAIDAKETIDAVTDLMLDNRTLDALKEVGEPTATEIRDYARARLVALGWPPKKAGTRRQTEKA